MSDHPFINEPVISPHRRSGNTTRLIDYYIQLLFVKGTITVIDHYDSDKSNKRLRGLILDRLRNEHTHDWGDAKFEAEPMKNTIKYIP